MANVLRTLGLVAAAAACWTACADEPISMDANSPFLGAMPAGTAQPLIVTVTNLGPGTRGVLNISESGYGEGFAMDYPIELPAGAKKELFVYPTGTYSYGTLDLVLRTDSGIYRHQVQPVSQSEVPIPILLISDTPGVMAFLNQKQAAPQKDSGDATMGALYCKPKSAPDRVPGFAGIPVTILGAGSERLSDSAVSAIKLWTLSGGTLVFVGGASSPVLTDPRWQGVLPAQQFVVANVDQSAVLTKLGGVAPPKFTVLSGTRTPGANEQRENGRQLWADRNFGAGKVIFLAFDPLDSPLDHWDGRTKTLMALLKPAEAQSRLTSIGRSGGASGGSYSRSVAGGGSYRYTYSSRAPAISLGGTSRLSLEEDPFSLQLPPTSKVLMILGLYFLAVVPLNFLILKKINRGELAWFTAPVLSLGFAGILFATVQQLYLAKMSTATSGTIVAQAGSLEGLFAGETQMFIPSGGTYDLGLTNVQSLVPNQTEGYGGMRPSGDNLAELNAVDVGEIKVPQLRARNLSFRRISYLQIVPAGDWLSVRKTQTGAWEVMNRSDNAISEASLWLGRSAIKLGNLAPGARMVVTSKGPTADPDAFAAGIEYSRADAVMITGSVQGFRPGPQLGHEVAGRHHVLLAYYAEARP